MKSFVCMSVHAALALLVCSSLPAFAQSDPCAKERRAVQDAIRRRADNIGNEQSALQNCENQQDGITAKARATEDAARHSASTAADGAMSPAEARACESDIGAVKHVQESYDNLRFQSQRCLDDTKRQSGFGVITGGHGCGSLAALDERERRDLVPLHAAVRTCVIKARAAAKEAEKAAEESGKRQIEDEAKDAAITNNHKAMSLVFGVEMCLAQAAKKDALAEIAKQKKYARIGGVESRLSLFQLQGTIRRADELLAKDRNLLRTASNLKGVRPLPCTDAGVRSLMKCKKDPSSDQDCDDEQVSRVLNFISTIYDDTEEP